MADEETVQASGSGKFPTPPYIAYKTLQTLFGDLKVHGLPPQIDRSVLTRFSGGVQGQVMIALRVLGLVDDKNVPTQKLASLVDAHETDRYQAAIKSLVEETYPYVLSIDLASATPSMFTKAFSEATGAGEESLRKCRAFFLSAARDAGITIGSRIEKAKFPRSRSSNGKKAKAKPAVGDTQAANPASPATPNSAQAGGIASELLKKFPDFDPAWPDNIKAKWFEGFEKFMSGVKDKGS